MSLGGNPHLTLPASSSQGQYLTAAGTWNTPSNFGSLAADEVITSSLTIAQPAYNWEWQFFGDKRFTIQLTGEISWWQRKACYLLFGSKWKHLRTGLGRHIEFVLERVINDHQEAKAA